MNLGKEYSGGKGLLGMGKRLERMQEGECMQNVSYICVPLPKISLNKTKLYIPTGYHILFQFSFPSGNV